MDSCALCKGPGASAVNGGYCGTCRPPLNVSLGPAALVARDIARTFGTSGEEA